MELFVIGLLIILSFLEGTVTTVPLVLLCLISIAAHTKSSRVYFYALGSGVVIDLLTGRQLGTTAIVYIMVLFLIFLYQRKYEIDSYVFVFFSSIILSLFFSLIFGSTHLLLQVLISPLLAELVFLLWKVLFLKSTPTTLYSSRL